MCDPDSDSGDWITTIDLQEKGDKLQLVEMSDVGKEGLCAWGRRSGGQGQGITDDQDYQLKTTNHQPSTTI